jgi:hypothetical protein
MGMVKIKFTVRTKTMKARIVFSHEDYSSEAVKRKISYLILLMIRLSAYHRGISMT